MWSKCGNSRKASRRNTLRPQPVSGVASPSSRARTPFATRELARLVRAPPTAPRAGPANARRARARQEDRNVRGVVLAIAVERGNPLAPSRAHASTHCGALAATPAMTQHTDRRAGLCSSLGQPLGGVVEAAVVHVDDLAGQRFDCRAYLGSERQDVRPFVARGHDDGQEGVGRHRAGRVAPAPSQQQAGARRSSLSGS